MSDPLSSYDPDSGEESGAAIPAQLRDPKGVLQRGYRWGVVAFAALVIPAVIVANLVPLRFESSSLLMMTAKAIPDQFVSSSIVQTGSQQFKEIRSRVFTRKRLAEIAEAELKETGGQSEDVASIVGTLRNDLEIEETTIGGSSGGSKESESLAIRIALAGKDPERVASLVNRVSNALIDGYLDYRSDQSQVTFDFMKREYERSDEALRAHQRKLAQFRDQYRGSLPEEQETTLARLERLESQRATLVLQISDARSQLAEVRSETITGSTERTLRKELEADLARLQVLYTEDHPQVQSVRRRLDALEEPDSSADPRMLSQQESIAQRRARIESEIESRQARLNDIDQEVAQLESQVDQTSEITEEFRALEREEVILQEAYSQNLRKLKSAELSRSLETSQKGAQLVRVEGAVPATSPMIPRFVFVVAAVFVAMVASLAFVVLHELVHPVVIDSGHLEQLTSVPLLGSIPPVG